MPWEGFETGVKLQPVDRQKGEPRVLAFLVGKVLVWYGIRENLLWLCGYIEKAGGASGAYDSLVFHQSLVSVK